jgi:hypothetical protein
MQVELVTLDTIGVKPCGISDFDLTRHAIFMVTPPTELALSFNATMAIAQID